MPYDTDGDHIPNGPDKNEGGDGYGGPNEVRDPEVLRAGNAHRGDGLSEYQEYRGMEIGGAWRALDALKAEVFVESTIGTGEFSKSGLTIVMVGPNDHQGGVIDWSSSAASRVIPAGQKRIRMRDGPGEAPEGYYGYCFGGPNIPSLVGDCIVDQPSLESWANAEAMRWNWNAQQTAYAKARARVVTITHELAHAVAMPHHPVDGPGECYMRYPTGPSILSSPPYHNEFCTTTGYNEVNLQMRLR